jgi:DNA polymerase-3 subunit epsilon
VNFLAIDFETANQHRTSACSLGLVRVENGKIARKTVKLIRPPTSDFMFTHIHGLSWQDVENAHTFAGIWPEIRGFFEDIDFVAAHNVGFDRRVLLACCELYGISAPELNYLCTVELSRETWQLFPTKLPDVCRFLKLHLNHHDALSDAEACANIVISALASENPSLKKIHTPSVPSSNLATEEALQPL